MAVFTKESTYYAPYNVQPTNEARAAICVEATREINSVFAGLYVADVRLEQKMLLEGANVNILKENILSTAWTKLKEIFKKFKDKIMSWFKAVKNYLIALFTSGKKFVQKYGKEVVDKANSVNMDKFEYEGYKKCEVGKSDGNIKELRAKIDEVEAAFNKLGKDKDITDDEKQKELNELKKVREEFEDGMDELTESKIEEQMMGDKKKISYSEGLNAKGMVDFVLKADKYLDDVEVTRKRIEKAVNDVIKVCDKNSTGEHTNKIEVAKEASSLLKKVIAEITRIFAIVKKNIETFTKQCIRVLKKIWNYRPAKESVEIKIEGDADLDISETPEADTVTATVADPEENLDGIATVTVTEDLDTMEGDEGEDPTTGDVTEEEPEAFLESCMKFF